MKSKFSYLLVGAIALAAFTGTVHAATITWTGNGTFTDDSVLTRAGTTADEVYGVDFGAGSVTTANGYTFADANGSSSSFTIASGYSNYNSYLGGGGSTGDSGLDSVLNYGDYGSTSITGALDNLMSGQTYTVLVLEADTRGGSVIDGRSFSVDSSTPVQEYAYSGGAPAVGGYLVGTFVADANTQSFTVNTFNSGDTSPDATQYQAILVTSSASIPEPSSWAMMLGGLGLMLFFARRRLS